jgi:2-polyprenyl-3-methyl-5-hydroxy-6-metoxy-1,4-benzoquinol methylase
MYSPIPPQERYLHKPFYGSSHWWALARCENLPAETRVLDVGPGSGPMGKVLRERGLTELYAVEIDERAFEFLKPAYNRVESKLSAFAEQQFDLVFLLDVLEHMTDPLAFLEELRPYLAPNATVLVSVPNVAHWSVRLLLLFGYFPYYSRGILDHSHLQFFTRGRLRNILKGANYLIDEEAVTIPPAEFVLPKPIWDNRVYAFLSSLHYGLAQLLSGFWGYQLLAKVRLG